MIDKLLTSHSEGCRLDTASKKKEIRANLLLQRGALPVEVCQEKSRQISNRLLTSPEFDAAGVIQCYLANATEVQTTWVIQEALRLKKRVAVPVIQPNNRLLSLSELADLNPNRLQSGPFGILQPRSLFVREVRASEVDLWIVPGVGFDEAGNRLGFGGGYYDRLLIGRRGEAIGLAFDFQIVDEPLPAEENDHPVDWIMTEHRTIFCRSGKGGGKTN
jgi:5-formyltetrahydrofolate cyclo-ligase